MVLPFVNVEGETFGEVYNKLLLSVYEYGVRSEKESYAFETTRDMLIRECESRVVIRNALAEPLLSMAMPGIHKFPDYIEDVLLGRKDYLVKKGIYTYTYHERIFPKSMNKGGQLATIIKKLRKNPFSNRAQLVTWQVPKDNLIDSGQPCLRSIWFKVYGDTLVERTYWRSRDLPYAWDENVAGMLGIGKLVIDCLNDYSGLSISRLYYVDKCDSLHVYEHEKEDYERQVKILQKRQALLNSTDPLPRRLWKGRDLFEAVGIAKETIFDPIFKG